MVEAKGVNGSVSFDGQFVTISRSGLMARATVGKGEKRIPISSVTAVQWKPPSKMVRGFIQFSVLGGNERRSGFGKQTMDAAKDENSVVVGWTQVAEFEELRAEVEAAVGRPSLAPSAPSAADELKKLAELRDAGVLSDAEFEAEKAKLLA
jgi:hypothetical protein